MSLGDQRTMRRFSGTCHRTVSIVSPRPRMVYAPKLLRTCRFCQHAYRAAVWYSRHNMALHAGEEAIPMEVVLSGTYTGTWFGIPPTGRRFEIPACAIFIFDEHDKIAGERSYFDSALMLRQMGLLPPS